MYPGEVGADLGVNVLDIQLTAGHWNQTGTWLSDNSHNHLGQTWVGANNALKIQWAFGAPDYAGVVLSNTAGHGLAIPNASINGIYVGTTGFYGMVVNDAALDGVYVNEAGNPSSATLSNQLPLLVHLGIQQPALDHGAVHDDLSGASNSPGR